VNAPIRRSRIKSGSKLRPVLKTKLELAKPDLS
jgi:hypothetical protein